MVFDTTEIIGMKYSFDISPYFKVEVVSFKLFLNAVKYYV